MHNKTLLLTAIAHSEIYSTVQTRILQELVKASADDGTITASVKYLHKAVETSIPSVYVALRALKNNGIIIETSEANSYRFNEEKLSRLVQLYNNKKSLLNE